jgi:hypothetical protein
VSSIFGEFIGENVIQLNPVVTANMKEHDKKLVSDFKA